MGFNDTPSASRTHIGFFGCRNAGKSSLVNRLTNQTVAVVSDVKGTTTDPVTKSMELLPIGPVVIIDTPGFDDEGKIGEMRVERTRQILNKTDAAVLVVDSTAGIGEYDEKLIGIFKAKNIPYIVAYNKSDLLNSDVKIGGEKNEVLLSSVSGDGIEELKNKIAAAVYVEEEKYLVRDLISANDVVVLVVPIDSAAPKGRIILPQQQAIRDILDVGGIAVVSKDTELEKTMSLLDGKVKLVITDSQAFGAVSKIVPKNVYLTSFSILMARYKGFLKYAREGAEAIDRLKDGDTVLIAEGCTHHRQCEDIGTVKIPKLLKKHTGADINFEFVSGGGFPEDLSKYSLIIHCGGCMLNEKEILYRMKSASDSKVPVTNYGIALAHFNGILKRSTEIIDE